VWVQLLRHLVDFTDGDDCDQAVLVPWLVQLAATMAQQAAAACQDQQ
jgi:hypothetical protein